MAGKRDRWVHHPDGRRHVRPTDVDDGVLTGRTGPLIGCSASGCVRNARYERAQHVAPYGEDPYLFVTYYCDRHAADEGCPNTTGK